MAPISLSLDHLVLTVKSIEESVAWYEQVLGMRRHDWQDSSGLLRTSLFWREGEGNWRKINLHESGKEVPPHAANLACGGADLCFVVGQKVSEIVSHLAECGVEIELGPVSRAGAMRPIRSVYVRDPDGNLIEIGEEGDTKWNHIAKWEDMF